MLVFFDSRSYSYGCSLPISASILRVASLWAALSGASSK